MNKEQFNQLEVLEQIQYINDKLQDNSLNQIVKDLGIGRTTISDRFKKLGYKYSKQLKQFQLIEQNKPIDKAQTVDNDTIDIISLLNRIEVLEDRIDKLEGKAKEQQYQVNPINENIRFYPMHQDTTYTMRINIDVFNRFKEFAKSHSQYKQRDLISSALEIYMELLEKE